MCCSPICQLLAGSSPVRLCRVTSPPSRVWQRQASLFCHVPLMCCHVPLCTAICSFVLPFAPLCCHVLLQVHPTACSPTLSPSLSTWSHLFHPQKLLHAFYTVIRFTASAVTKRGHCDGSSQHSGKAEDEHGPACVGITGITICNPCREAGQLAQCKVCVAGSSQSYALSDGKTQTQNSSQQKTKGWSAGWCLQ